MLRAFLPSRRWHVDQGFPDLLVDWRNFRIETEALGAMQRVAGSTRLLSAGKLSLIAPHVIGFRLLMVMLTHPA
jgi:hypothetical protein